MLNPEQLGYKLTEQEKFQLKARAVDLFNSKAISTEQAWYEAVVEFITRQTLRAN